MQDKTIETCETMSKCGHVIGATVQY